MDVGAIFTNLGIALGLGLLVGMQRERVAAPLAGVRTFALITMLGALSGVLATTLGPWLVAVGLAAVAITTGVGNVLTLRTHRVDVGITTEIAVLLMFLVGASLAFVPAPVAVVVAGSIAVLLHAKPFMHDLVTRMGEADMRVVMQFVLITLVILPVLPDRAYGPYRVLNPREVWMMVVLVVGISLAGWIALKLVGERAGIVLVGLIGGLISSTATTVSHARHAAGAKGQVAATALVVLLATTVVYARVLVEVGVVAPAAWWSIAPPILVLMAVSAALCVALWWRHRHGRAAATTLGNPTELRSALVFGALYGLVLLAVAWAQDRFGASGVYLAAAMSGLTDLDAITLSTSRLVAAGADAGVAWRAIVIALLSNLAFKAGIVAALGGLASLRPIAIAFGVEIAVGIALLLSWPG